MNHSYKKIIVPALLGTLFLGACSDDASFEGEGKQQTYSLVVKGITTSGSDSSEELRDVSVFQFSDGNLYKTQQLTPESNGQSSISALSGSRLYFLTGVTLPVQEEGITEEEFRNMTIGEELHNNSAPDFMAAIVELESTPQTRSNQEINVGMKRGVARIDLNTTADSKTLIKEIIVKDAPAETYPFIENASASDKTVSYLKKFDPAFGGEQQGIFRIFESKRPVNIILRGTYNEIPISLKMQLPSIERNKIYELSVLNVGATVEGIFEIKPWEEGETIIGKPDTEHRILLNASQSKIPEGITVDYENNIVEVPATGVSDMKLAFVSDTRIDISATEGTDSGVNLSEMSVSEETEGIISAFNVSVAAQGSGRLGYTILVHLKNALLSGSYDYVEIRVAPSDKQIETVEMGGSIWMAFNARSRDLEDQVYPLDGATVEEMYRNGWVSSIGKAVTAKEVITRTVKVTNVGKPSVAEERSKITPVSAIKVTPTSGTVAKGKTTTLTVTVEPENATDKTFRAISADPSKATISVKDMTITVTGVKDGKVSIPVISGNGQFAAVAEITVNNVPGG